MKPEGKKRHLQWRTVVHNKTNPVEVLIISGDENKFTENKTKLVSKPRSSVGGCKRVEERNYGYKFRSLNGENKDRSFVNNLCSFHRS